MSDDQTVDNVIDLRSRRVGSQQIEAPPFDDSLAMSLESLLYVSPTPLKLATLAEATERSEDEVENALLGLMGRYSEPVSGIVLERVAGGWAFRASDGSRDAIERLYSPPADTRLTPAAAETLAVIAYLQPISRPEIARIRGVSVDAAVANLLERGFVEEAGRSATGAVQFRTTALFERAFGLASLAALPQLEGFAPGVDETQKLREQLEQIASSRVD